MTTQKLMTFEQRICVSDGCFVNMTLEDNFPTTSLEALACGTPVITFRTGGSPEAIDETCGYVVKKMAYHKFTRR